MGRKANPNIKTFSVCLDKKNVAGAKKQMEHTGGKLSPIINSLLEGWIYFKDDAQRLIDMVIKKREDTKK